MPTRVTRADESAVDVKFCLVFPREALSVPVMRHVLGDALRWLGADEEGAGELLLAVTEACTNVLRHGGPGSRYEVVASLGPGGCRVEVLNTGPGADPLRLAGARPRRPPWPAMPASVRLRRRGARPATFGWPHRRARQVARDDAIASLPESGRGLAIMRAFVDDVTMTSEPEHGTVVSLRKHIAWRPDGRLPYAAVVLDGSAPARLRDAG